MEYEGVFITDQYTEFLKEFSQTALSKEVNKTVGVKCQAKDGEQGVSLWQWITTSNDQENLVFTELYVCRYGDLFNT